MSDGDRAPASGPLFIGAILLGLTLLSAVAAWLLKAHWMVWWAEKGIQLPGITVLWMSPIWHVVGAVVLAVFSGLVAVRGAFAIGLGMWVVSYLLYVAHTFLAIYLPWYKVTTMLGVKASASL